MSDPKAQDDTKSDRYLPHSRIRTIMKSSADPVSLSIKDESLQVVCRATEMFIQLLAKESYKSVSKTKTVEYKHLAEYVQGEERLEFLHQIVPKKITVKQFRNIMAKKSDDKSDNSSSDTSSSGSESGSGSGSADDDDDDNDNEDGDEGDEEEEEEEEEEQEEPKKSEAKKGKKDTANIIKAK